MYYIHKLLLYCQDSFCTCLLLSNDKFYIHFVGSVEYWINEYGYEKVRLLVRLRAKQHSRYGGDRSYQQDRFKAIAFYAPAWRSVVRGAGRVCKIAMYVKFCDKHVLYVNPRIFLSLLSLSEFAYTGPTNLNFYRAHNYLNRPPVSSACNDARFQASVAV